MARPKRSSRVLAQAEQREADLKTIDPNLKFSDELTLLNYSTLIQELRDQVAEYNAALSTLDVLTRKISVTEKNVRDRSEQMLLGVAVHFGKDSDEYGKAGGTLKSERRRPTKKKLTEEPSAALLPMKIATLKSEDAITNAASN
jgi:hypothetical protein